MNPIPFLAAVEQEMESSAAPLMDISKFKDYLWSQITGLDWIIALLIISVGIVYLLYGWRIFRVLVVISFGFMGMFLGMLVSDKLWPVNQDAMLWSGLVGTVVFAFFAVPLMKWCVSMLGAIAGGVIGAGVWLALGLSEAYMPAGFIAGCIAGGLISFIMLKVSVMLFTSLAGSIITVTGMLSLLYQYEPLSTKVNNYYYGNDWFLSLVVIVPTLIGMILQNNFIKNSPQWDIADKKKG